MFVPFLDFSIHLSILDVTDFLKGLSNQADVAKEIQQLESKYEELTASLSTSVHDHYDAFITTSRHVKGFPTSSYK